MDVHLAPNTVPALVDEAGPINVEAELRAIVALTRHYWKHRLNILVDAPEPGVPFWSRWWIARFAAMRMLMLAADCHDRAPANFNSNQLPSVRIGGRLEGTRFELWLWMADRGSGLESTLPDLVLLSCAKCLGGQISVATPRSGESRMSFVFPVRLTTATPIARKA
jgi:hypothetical protein